MPVPDAALQARTLCIHNIPCAQSAPEDYVGVSGSILAYVMKQRGHRRVAITYDALTPGGLRQQHLAVTYDEVKWAQTALFDMRGVCKELYPDTTRRPLVATLDRLHAPAFTAYVRFQDTTGFSQARKEALCALAAQYGRLHAHTPSRFHGFGDSCFSAFVNFAEYRGALRFLAAGQRDALEIRGHKLSAAAQSNTEWLSAMRERMADCATFTLAQAVVASHSAPPLRLRDDARAVLMAWFVVAQPGLFREPPQVAALQAPLRLETSQDARKCKAPDEPDEPDDTDETDEADEADETDTPNEPAEPKCQGRDAVQQPAGPGKEPPGSDAARSLWELEHAEVVAFFRRHALPTAGLLEAGLDGANVKAVVLGDPAGVLDTFLPKPPHGLGFVHRLKYTVVFADAVRAEFGIVLPALPSALPRNA